MKTSTGVMDLRKDSSAPTGSRTTRLGVVDPLDTKATTLKGQGKRVTLKDASDKVLADFIIGKEVENHPGQRFVRVPGQKRTYAVNVKVDLSTRFADWIETNLLKIDAGKVRKVVIEATRGSTPRRAGRPGRGGHHRAQGRLGPLDPRPASPEGKELDTEKLRSLTKALGDLKIAGIRPKPRRTWPPASRRPRATSS